MTAMDLRLPRQVPQNCALSLRMPAWSVPRIGAAVFFISTLLTTSCGSGGHTSRQTATPGPTATVMSGANHTGISEVDAVIAAAQSRNPQELTTLLRYRSVACAAAPIGLGPFPQCLADEPNGTPVHVFPVGYCEGVYVRPENISQLVLSHLPLADSKLYAVYRLSPSDGFGGVFYGGQYAVILSRPLATATQGVGAWALVVGQGGVAGVAFGCGESPQQLVQVNQLVDVLLPPH